MARCDRAGRPSLRPSRARLSHNRGGADSGYEIDEDDLAAGRLDHFAPDDFVAPVVRALEQNLWPHVSQKLERGVLIENDDQIDSLQGRQHLGPRMDILHGATAPLQAPHRGIAVEADNEAVASRMRLRQQLDVPGVQYVETAVGEADA